MPVGLNDTRRILQEIDEDYNRIKSSKILFINSMMTFILSLLPRRFIPFYAIPSSGWVTSIPGFEKEVRIAGVSVDYVLMSATHPMTHGIHCDLLTS